MKTKAVCLALWCALAAWAQQPNVPRVTNFSGVVTDATGKPQTGMVGITFALYEAQEGGTALWSETQNVALDGQGRYTVLLGSTQPEGLPLAVFASGQARWLGVTPQVAGVAEQPRVLLVGVPYALKAADADTLGGLPASAFLPAASTGMAVAPSIASLDSASPGDTPATVTGSGKADYIPMWSTATKLGSSVLFQSGTGATAEVGINTATPASTLDVNGTTTLGGATTMPAAGTATTGTPYSSQPLNLVASAYNTGVGGAVAQTFQLQAEPVGNDSAATSGTLNLLYGVGANAPLSVLQIASNGEITFATGQTFPHTVTKVSSGAGLTGGPITSSGTLSIATGQVSNAMLTNPSLTVTAGTGMTGGGAVPLGGSTTLALNTGLVPLLGSANTFTMPQTISANLNLGANLSLPNTNSTGTLGVISLGGVPFLQNYSTTAGCSTTSGGCDLFLGPQAGNLTTGGAYNVAIGGLALNAITTGSYNTATGAATLYNNTTGTFNTATGTGALYYNTTGGSNTAAGLGALSDNTTGGNNTATGVDTLYRNTTGVSNTATGTDALFYNTTANDNVATGYQALLENTTGHDNTGTGTVALESNTTGSLNTATGSNAMYQNTTGGNNTAEGYYALNLNQTAYYNTAFGAYALADATGSANTAVGDAALQLATTGSGNVALGASAGYYVTTGGNNIEIGNNGTSGDNGVIRIGSGSQSETYIAAISGVNVSGAPVYVTSSGQLGVQSSSRRYKEDIQDMGNASSGVLRLRPVTFHYKQAFADGTKPLEFGLIAEEVAEVYPDMVVRSASGQIETVKYQELAPMLLNELQKQNAAIAAQAQQLRELTEQNRELVERLERLEAASSAGAK